MRTFQIQLEENTVGTMTLTEDEMRERFPNIDLTSFSPAADLEEHLYQDALDGDSIRDYLRERGSAYDSALRVWEQ